LSTKAGLRAGEIAKLTWDMVLGAGGEVGAVLELRDHAAKMGSGRLIPLHLDLQEALFSFAEAVSWVLSFVLNAVAPRNL
jgi:hypothetical protein